MGRSWAPVEGHRIVSLDDDDDDDMQPFITPQPP